MFMYSPSTIFTSLSVKPRSPFPTRNSANFARQATIDAFGWRFARALDQADFVDRLPGQLPLLSSEACFR